LNGSVSKTTITTRGLFEECGSIQDPQACCFS
jgi:hypothetical protein